MTSATEFQAKVDKASVNMDRLDGIVNGGPDAVIGTDGGDVPSIAKAIADLEDDGADALTAMQNAVAAAAQLGLSAIKDPFPAAAATNVPRGATSFNLTPGSGGTNALNVVCTLSGGNFLINPVVTVDIVSGAITNVRVQAGLYIGSSPTVPTVTVPGAAGGGAVVLVAGFLIPSGLGYWVLSSDGYSYIHYNNVVGVATLDTSVKPLPTNAQLSETVYDYCGVASPTTGAAPGGGSTRWVFYGAAPTNTILVTEIVADVKVAGAQKLEFWTGPDGGNNYTQAMADVVVTPPSTGLQTLVAPTHFTAFTLPAGVRPGMFGTWIGQINGTENRAVSNSGVDGATTFFQPTISNVDFQIRFKGSRTTPIALEARLNALDDAVEYTQTTHTQVGASAAVAGATASSATPWTIAIPVPQTGPVDQIFVDYRGTVPGPVTARLIRSGSQVGPDHIFTATVAGPQTLAADFTDARAGDFIRIVNTSVGINNPASGDDVAVTEVSGYGFRLGYRQTIVTTQPLKDKVAAIAAGGSDLAQKLSCYGDSLTHYDQDVPNSFPSKLATLLGLPVDNFGVSGQTPAQIETRFNAAPATWNNGIIFEAYNGFSNIDTYMPPLMRMVAKMGPAHKRRLIILSCLTGDPTSVGGTTYINQIKALNSVLKAVFPDNFLDWHEMLMQNGLRYNNITPTSGDLAALAGGYIPPSLRISGDYLHLTGLGYAPAAQFLFDSIVSRGWFS